MQRPIIKTTSEIKEGIKYTTHYVNRPIQPGDPHGGCIGITIGKIKKTTEIINYVYLPENSNV